LGSLNYATGQGLVRILPTPGKIIGCNIIAIIEIISHRRERKLQ
jgi:hypothetical protein